MAKSRMYDKIKKWYKDHYWTLTMVRQACEKGKITEEEFKEITGEDF